MPTQVIGVTRDLRVLWAAEETGVLYRVKALDYRRDLKARDYLKINPFAHIPSIDDNGFKLFESGAIVFYLADKAKKLMPKDPGQRALARQWAFAAVNTVEIGMAEVFFAGKFGSDAGWPKQRIAEYRKLIGAHLTALDGELAKKPYLLGDDFTAPDILMTTVLRIIDFTRMIDNYPHLVSYKAQCESRPAWKKIFSEYQQRLAA
ncbi:MAG: glutathione S-transferase family protein [Steroidobacteraceae bacterium]